MDSIVRYIADKNKAEHHPLRIYRNVPSMRLNDIPQAFEDNLRFQTAQNIITAYHNIISFHPHDTPHICRDTIRDLVQQYINRRAPRSLWFGQLHTDQDHPHVHLLLSGNEYLHRRASRIPRSAFYQLRVDMEAYQKEHYPEMTYSINYNKMRVYPLDFLYSRLCPVYENAPTKNAFWTSAHKALEGRATIHPITQEILYLGKSYTVADIGIDLSIFDRLEALQQSREGMQRSQKWEQDMSFDWTW